MNWPGYRKVPEDTWVSNPEARNIWAGCCLHLSQPRYSCTCSGSPGIWSEVLHLTIKPVALETTLRTKCYHQGSLPLWRTAGSVAASEVLMNWNIHFKDSPKLGLQQRNTDPCNFHPRMALLSNLRPLCTSWPFNLEIKQLCDCQASLRVTKTVFPTLTPHSVLALRFERAFLDHWV